MRLSIPGVPGIYYDTDARSTALTVALTAAGRRAPKPHGYAVQVLPYLWSFDVDLREVPADHPLQYLHPEGARSVDQLTRDQLRADVGPELDRVLRLVWAVNEETETALERLVGIRESEEGVIIEIEDEAVEGDESAAESGAVGPAELGADDDSETPE